MQSTRRYRFAGSFYPMQKSALAAFVSKAVNESQVDKRTAKALAYQVPHAGYMYSGRIAAHAYKALSMNPRLDKIETVILIGPNHTGYGKPIAVSGKDWETPLGVAKNDIELSESIADGKFAFVDDEAHADEHSLEVQLPFLQHIIDSKNIKYSFICMGDQSLDASIKLSKLIEKALSETGRSAIVIASSDLNHYEPASIAAKKDSKIIEAMSKLDYVGLNKLIDELNISACGYGPISVAIMHALSNGAHDGVMLAYGNSGSTTGDFDSVVEYSAFAFV
ncbi:MAG: AmmeMemoRadiSam system protein B [Candidatus Micrarchaeia archaeon]